MLSIGDIIRTNRDALNISQETLSHGICSVSNLSRIENGMQIPSRATYELLMERMGLSPNVFPSFINNRELSAFTLKHEIALYMTSDKYDKVEELIKKLKKEPKLDKIYKQFIYFVETIILRRRGGNPNDVLDSMKRVLAMSVKDFDAKKILRYLLTKDEISMINNLAISYRNADDEDYAIDILYSLKEYIEKKVVDYDGISSTYTAILHNLSKWVGLKGNHDEVIRLCDLGIHRSLKYGRYTQFPGVLFNKGYALVKLGRKEEARKYIQEAYYLDRAIGRTQTCEITKKFADENDIEI